MIKKERKVYMGQNDKVVEFEYSIKQEDGVKWSRLSYSRSVMYKRGKNFLIWYPTIFVIILIILGMTALNSSHVAATKTVADYYDLAWRLLGVLGVYFMLAIFPVVIIPRLVEKNAKKIYNKREGEKEILEYSINSESIKIVTKKINAEYSWEKLRKIEYNGDFLLLYDKVRVLDVIPLKTLNETDKEIIFSYARNKLSSKDIVKI